MTAHNADDVRAGTHWVGCWRAHHECAIFIIERLLDGVIDDALHRLGGRTPGRRMNYCERP